MSRVGASFVFGSNDTEILYHSLTEANVDCLDVNGTQTNNGSGGCYCSHL